MARITVDEDKVFEASALLESIRTMATAEFFTVSGFCSVIAKVQEAEKLLDVVMRGGELVNDTR